MKVTIESAHPHQITTHTHTATSFIYNDLGTHAHHRDFYHGLPNVTIDIHTTPNTPIKIHFTEDDHYEFPFWGCVIGRKLFNFNNKGLIITVKRLQSCVNDSHNHHHHIYGHHDRKSHDTVIVHLEYKHLPDHILESLTKV